MIWCQSGAPVTLNIPNLYWLDVTLCLAQTGVSLGHCALCPLSLSLGHCSWTLSTVYFLDSVHSVSLGHSADQTFLSIVSCPWHSSDTISQVSIITFLVYGILKLSSGIQLKFPWFVSIEVSILYIAMTRDLGTEVLNQIFGHKIRALMSSTKSRNKLIYKSITLKDDSLRDDGTLRRV